MIRKTRIVSYAIAIILGATVLSVADHAKASENSKQTTSRSPAVTWGTENGGIRCSIDVADGKLQCAADEPIWIRCRTRKVSDDKATIVSRGASVYSVTVTNQEGESVPKTRYGTPRSFRPSSGTATQEWEVGREEVMKIHLNRLFDMTRPGKYRVSFSRKLILPDGSTAQVESNSLTVVIANTDAYVAEPPK